MNASRTVSVSIGGPGSDNFVFKPGVGLDTIVNFDPTHDTIEFDHFATVQTLQQLESLITTDAHGDAVIALGHHDSITVANVTAAQVQQLAQSGHVLMH
jgi:Ca2+-binding RTX toxin-like protein